MPVSVPGRRAPGGDGQRLSTATRQVALAAMRIPDDKEIFALHVRHAPTPEALAVVYTHSEIVRRIAMRLLDGPGPAAEGIDAGLVRAGSSAAYGHGVR